MEYTLQGATNSKEYKQLNAWITEGKDLFDLQNPDFTLPDLPRWEKARIKRLAQVIKKLDKCKGGRYDFTYKYKFDKLYIQRYISPNSDRFVECYVDTTDGFVFSHDDWDYEYYETSFTTFFKEVLDKWLNYKKI